MKRRLRKWVASSLIALIALQPAWAAAQVTPNAPSAPQGESQSDYIKSGKELGDWAGEFVGDRSERTADDFFSDEGQANNFDGAFKSPDELQDSGDSENAVTQAGLGAAADFRQNPNTAGGSAFTVAEEQAQRRPMDLSQSSVFGSTDDLLNAMENPDQFNSLCGTQGAPAAEEVICDQAGGRDNACTASHAYSAGLIEHLSGPYNLNTCGEGCLDIWIGKKGNNYRDGGTCRVFSEDVSFRVLYPDAINSASLVEAQYDDHLQIYLNTLNTENGSLQGSFDDAYQRDENLVWHSPYGWDDAWASGARSCERSTSNTLQPSTNVTSQVKSDVLNFRLVNAVGGKGEAYARIRINYDPAKVIESEGWSSDSCEAQAELPGSAVQCTKMPDTNENGCVSRGGIEICEHHFGSDAQFPGVSPLCEAVRVTSAGESTPTAGAQSCDVALEGRDGCSIVSSECVEYSSIEGSATEENPDGQRVCDIYRNTYECGGRQSGFDCGLKDNIPGAFDDCEVTYEVSYDDNGSDIDYTVSDIRTCQNIKKLSTCDLERKVSVEEEEFNRTRSASGCFESKTYTFSPSYNGTRVRGTSALEINDRQHMSASLTETPSEANGWEMEVTVDGAREDYDESVPAEHVDSNYYCPEGYSLEDGVCRTSGVFNSMFPPTEEKIYSCDSLNDDIPGFGGESISEWTLDGETCKRSYSTCKTPVEPSINFTAKFNGLFLKQEVIHHPADDGVGQCIIQSDDFTSTHWQCEDQGTRTINTPWGGNEYLSATDLMGLPKLYPDNPGGSEHTVTQGESDGKGNVCWYAKGEYNKETGGNTEAWIGESETYTDIYGDEQRTINEGVGSAQLKYNTCAPLESDPQCKFLETRCMEGGSGHEDFCYIESYIYECGEVGTVESPTIIEKNTCEAIVDCEGDDCFGEQQQSTMADFAESASMLQAVEQMATDMSCTGVDENGVPTGDENVNCRVFKGEGLKCKVPIGDSIHGHNCCDVPSGVNLGDYLQAITAMPKMDAALMGLEGGAGGAVKGAYSTLRTPVTNTFEAVKQPFVNSAENIMGAAEPITAPVKQFYDDAASFVKDGIANISEQLGANIGGSAGGSAATNEITNQAQASFSEQMLGASGAQALNMLSTAYTAYAVTMLAIQIIWKCEEDEFKLAAKRDMKSCHYLGSYCSSDVLGVCVTEKKGYCCYSSPLARIINEQGKGSLGTAKNPSCEGFTIDEFANLDWDNLDLSEWIGMLDKEGLMPDPLNMSPDTIAEDNPFNYEGDRGTTIERTEKRFDGLDVDNTRREADDDATIPKWVQPSS